MEIEDTYSREKFDELLGADSAEDFHKVVKGIGGDTLRDIWNFIAVMARFMLMMGFIGYIGMYMLEIMTTEQVMIYFLMLIFARTHLMIKGEDGKTRILGKW